MKKSELRKIIKETIVELSGFSTKGHEYTKIKRNIFAGEDGLLGPQDELIDWAMVKQLIAYGKKQGWTK